MPVTVFDLIAALTTIAAVLAWANYRFVKLPMTIGLMVLSLVSSLVIVIAGRLGVVPIDGLTDFVQAINFDDTVLNGMLGALLFAGALHLDSAKLIKYQGLILTLATVSVLMTTAVVGIGGWYLFTALGLTIPLSWMLVFGALIAPTDPIAVGAILRRVGVPKELETTITGESLFNDGVGVVLFILLIELLGGEAITAATVAKLVAVEVIGGLVYGAILGYVVFRMLRAVDNYAVEILLTLALVTGGYAFAHVFHVSGPLAMVVAGLIIGTRGRQYAMSETTRHRLDQFWELVDEFLNAVLFVLIGLEVVILDVSDKVPVAAVLAIPLVLLARFISVAIPVAILPSGRSLPRGAAAILTWSGLRGGISVALALSLPASLYRDKLIAITYVIVCFSIIVQGLTVGKVTARILARSEKREA
ncbi:MAG TPA: sodium:proton antiporter [Gemmatimonadales bacterium]|nr:sodium:proton antiporter [Gemmatimonadales bacterium]